MTPHADEWTWLDASEILSLPDLSLACRMSTQDVDELVHYGALSPLAGPHPEPVFSAACVGPLRVAARLRTDFDLDLFTVALLLGYLDRIDALEGRVKTLQAHLPGHVHLAHHDGPRSRE
ncbi:MAG: chaperone modulator CbpM [Ramlibacter sp.]